MEQIMSFVSSICPKKKKRIGSCGGISLTTRENFCSSTRETFCVASSLTSHSRRSPPCSATSSAPAAAGILAASDCRRCQILISVHVFCRLSCIISARIDWLAIVVRGEVQWLILSISLVRRYPVDVFFLLAVLKESFFFVSKHLFFFVMLFMKASSVWVVFYVTWKFLRSFDWFSSLLSGALRVNCTSHASNYVLVVRSIGL